MATSEIRVNPAELRRYAETIGKCDSSYQSSLQNAKSQIDGLKNIWTGEAASAFQTSFQGLYNKCQEGLELLSRLQNALYESADNYERQEKAVEQAASNMPKLPTNMMR
jgi:WXG100 family type VII secretion target